MKDKERFQIATSQGTVQSFKVIVDTETGVNYLYVASGFTSGLSVLVDKDGNPLISKSI